MNVKTFFRKVQNRIFHRMLGRLYFQGEDFYSKPSLKKVAMRNFFQSLNERGCQTPFIYTNEECLAFWKSVDNNPANMNRPDLYAEKGNQIVNFLHNFWTPEVSRNDSILELGCNCGVNLSHLKKMGYTKLSGVEINPHAIEQMDKSFPDLRKSINLSVGDFGEILSKMKTGEVDVIYTMGVSVHIHPTRNYIFKEMARVAKKFICTIEAEASNSNYVFARNFRRVFEKHGCRQLKSVLVGDFVSESAYFYSDCTVRLFKI